MILGHEGEYYESWYCHLNALLVKVGDIVKQGDVLGPAGSTGNSTGVHLHFNIRKQGHYAGVGYAPYDVVDPLPLLGGTPPAPLPTGVEMAPYFTPVGDYGDILILKNSWGAGDERTQLQKVGNLAYIVKNSQWERRRIADDGIHLELDTSPGDNEYYTVYGSPWLPLSWSVGNDHTRIEAVKFYRKSDCGLVRQGGSTNIIRFEKHYPTWTSPAGIVITDVIELAWIIGGVVEERYRYGRHLGLVGWENRSGFKSWVSERIAVGQQGNNTREIIGCL